MTRIHVTNLILARAHLISTTQRQWDRVRAAFQEQDLQEADKEIRRSVHPYHLVFL